MCKKIGHVAVSVMKALLSQSNTQPHVPYIISSDKPLKAFPVAGLLHKASVDHSITCRAQVIFACHV